ncbi:hypothetical protein Fot_21934 [Forsythia ovata]|uniref:Uncharacterized protein n=1 Tax=Forsythia ovata TaxID=205694 RepID=A0ABD1UWA2_9LAMI
MRKDPFSKTSDSKQGVCSSIYCSTGCRSGWGVSSFLPTLSAACILVAIVPLMVGVVGGDSASLLEASMKLSEDVLHQDKGKEVVIDEWEKVVLKKTLEDEGDAVDSGRAKRGPP